MAQILGGANSQPNKDEVIVLRNYLHFEVQAEGSNFEESQRKIILVSICSIISQVFLEARRLQNQIINDVR